MWLRIRANSRVKNGRLRGERFRIVSFACAIGTAVAFVLAAGPKATAFEAQPSAAPVASASSINGKSANLNGAPMAAGATLFPGDVIHLGEGSTAALQFGKSLVLAAPETELVIQAEGVSLRDGRLQVRASGSQPFAVAGPFFHVNVAASSGAPSTAEIRFANMRAQITAVSGFADLTSDGYDSAYRLHAGETATLDASPAAPQGANQDAGEISRLTPQVQIDRDLQHLVAAATQRVLWYDDLRSGPTGRAHVTLNDGSQINLGSDSSLLILQHDTQAQQTSLDLVIGRVRGQIIKLTKPSAKFEVRTPLGVAGLVGTDFSLQVTSDYVELMVFDGVVRFTALDAKVVTVNAGMKVRIFRQGPFDGPNDATAQEQQTAKNLTDVTDTPAQTTAQQTVATGKRHLVPIIVAASGAAAAGVAVGVYELTRPKVSNSAP
jgi:FecR protein